MHPESRNYLDKRGQFRLDHLTTEQRHPKTLDLTATVAQDTAAGLQMLLSVDEDILALVDRLIAAPQDLMAASGQVQAALQSYHKIFVYGCGSTGRLAKTLEALWRQFFEKADALGLQPADPSLYNHLRNAVVGEITGGDRALISSLEGFEDLPIVGELQLASHDYRPDDVLFAVSEGGETSSVLGALAAARRGPEMGNKRTYFVFNNPPEQLQSLTRSRAALDDAGIIKINLTTGPQAIAGSTRMQATSSELLVLGSVLEDALAHVLAPLCSPQQMAALQLDPSVTLSQRLQRFAKTLDGVRIQVPHLVRFTDAETEAYRAGRRAIYRADRALATVFTDATERSPTFRLAPLDPISEHDAPPGRHGWLHVACSAQTAEAAWHTLLGRDFLGLDVTSFGKRIEARVDDEDLLAAAKRSLERAGPEEGQRYDLSAASLTRLGWRPERGDFCLAIGVDDERWSNCVCADGDKCATYRITVGDDTTLSQADATWSDARSIQVQVPADALNLHKNIALKLVLNAHSTAVMCKMGRVVGNTMVAVQPSNLKLIGRATFLVQSHVNDILRSRHEPLMSYDQANSLVFEAIDVRAQHDADTCPPEVSMAVAMGVLRREQPDDAPTWDSSIASVQASGLEAFKRKRMQSAIPEPAPPKH